VDKILKGAKPGDLPGVSAFSTPSMPRSALSAGEKSSAPRTGTAWSCTPNVRAAVCAPNRALVLRARLRGGGTGVAGPLLLSLVSLAVVAEDLRALVAISVLAGVLLAALMDVVVDVVPLVRGRGRAALREGERSEGNSHCAGTNHRQKIPN
jgi:hypothetical protein